MQRSGTIYLQLWYLTSKWQVVSILSGMRSRTSLHCRYTTSRPPTLLWVQLALLELSHSNLISQEDQQVFDPDIFECHDERQGLYIRMQRTTSILFRLLLFCIYIFIKMILFVVAMRFLDQTWPKCRLHWTELPDVLSPTEAADATLVWTELCLQWSSQVVLVVSTLVLQIQQ